MRSFFGKALLTAGLMYIASGTSFAIDTNIQSYVCSKLDDLTATMVVVKFNERELSKINKDAVMLYRFKQVKVYYKEPDMVRIDGSQDGTSAVFVLNGPIQYVSVPKLHMVTKRNFGNAPGKRKSIMDLGLISQYYLTYTNAKFLREGSVDGVPCAVFDMTYKDRDEDTSHHIIYVDPKTKTVMKREAYRQDGSLQAIYYYRKPLQVEPGIWVPTEVEAMTTDRKVAAITAYKSISVNDHLANSLFRL
jgi:outer membrane lipoprotein-sorting protein